MSLSRMEQAAFRLFGRAAAWQARKHPRLASTMERAYMPQAPEAYLAYLDLLAMMALAEGLAALVIVGFALPAAGLAVPLPATLLVTLLALLLPLMVFAVGLLWPEVRAAERGARADVLLPGALNYMAAMASSGMTPDRILASLGRQQVYGEVAEEARRVAAEARWMGRDLLGALNDAVPRAPSTKLQEIWQGMASTIASGASLKTYLLAKAEQMHRDNAGAQRRLLEGLGVMAESFLVVAVASPIFLILLLVVMGSSGPGAGSSKAFLWVLVLVMVPAVQAGFAFSVRSVRGRV